MSQRKRVVCDDASIAKIIRMSKAGHTGAEIGAVFGVSSTTINVRLRDAGAGAGRGGYRKTKWSRVEDLALAMAKAGRPLNEIAQAVGMTANMVSIYLRQNGLAPIRTSKWQRVKDQAVKMLDDGAPVQDVANALGISMERIYKNMAKDGRPVNRTPRRRAPYTRKPIVVDEEILRWYNEGLSYAQIAKRRGVSSQWIGFLVKRWQLPKRERLPRPKGVNVKYPRNEAAIRAYLDGSAQHAVAAIIGCSISHVPKLMHRWGVPPRDLRRTTLTPAQIKSAAAIYLSETGRPGTALALSDQFGVSPMTMCRYLRKEIGAAKYRAMAIKRQHSARTRTPSVAAYRNPKEE